MPNYATWYSDDLQDERTRLSIELLQYSLGTKAAADERDAFISACLKAIGERLDELEEAYSEDW